MTKDGWKKAKELKQGDRVYTFVGKWVYVEDITVVHEKTTVYNFNVIEDHTYFANGFLVHNVKPDPDKAMNRNTAG